MPAHCNQPDRAAALAQAGTVLVQLGRSRGRRKLIEEAAEAAARLGTMVMEGYAPGVVARRWPRSTPTAP